MTEPIHDLVSPEQRSLTQERLDEARMEYRKLLRAFKDGTVSEEALVDTLAARSATAQTQIDRADERATKDTLTGLLNERGFDDHYKKVVERLRRSQEGGNPESAVVINMDLNGLKEVNDKEGHEAGNEMLRRFAQLLHANSRAVDTLAIVSRPHGDEFFAVLSNTNQKGAAVWGKRMLSKLDEADLRVSIGSADIDPNNPSESLKIADAAMYRAKGLKSNGTSTYMQSKFQNGELTFAPPPGIEVK